MTDDPDMPPVTQTAWLEHLISTAESAAASLRDRDDPTTDDLIADMDALCLRLRRELDDIK
jgi:hypothetical protein